MLNLTQHVATAEQLAAGVIEPEPYYKRSIQELLTFPAEYTDSPDGLPTHYDIVSAAEVLADIAEELGATSAMIGGAPFLMASLERALLDKGITPYYAFSNRVAVETATADGGVAKTSIFRHLGFVRAVAAP